MRGYRFCLCPRGNGLDVHRMWECLLVGSVPIYLSNDPPPGILHAIQVRATRARACLLVMDVPSPACERVASCWSLLPAIAGRASHCQHDDARARAAPHRAPHAQLRAHYLHVAGARGALGRDPPTRAQPALEPPLTPRLARRRFAKSATRPRAVCLPSAELRITTRRAKLKPTPAGAGTRTRCP